MTRRRRSVAIGRGPLRATASSDRALDELPSAILAYLEQRIVAALEWYRSCDVCEQTLVNVRRDLDSVMADTCKKFGVARMPFLLRTQFEGAELVVSAVTREVS